MNLPDSWTNKDPSKEDEDALKSERIIEHEPSTLTLQVIPSIHDEKFQLLIMMNSAGGGWLFEGDNKVEDVFDEALSFVEIFQSMLEDNINPGTTEYLKALGGALIKAGLSPTPSLSVDRTPENDVEAFFNGYIPFHFSDPTTQGAELCCPPGASLMDETHYRTTPSSEPLNSSYHVVWKESFGKGLGWYCPDCSPSSLADVDRLNIPCSDEWNDYIEKLESGETGEGGLPPTPEMGHLTGGMMVRLFQSDVLKREPDSKSESDEAGWYYNQETHRRIVDTPEDWGQFVVGGDEDILIKCDIIGVNLSYNNGLETRFAAIRNPRLINRETRIYPWNNKK